MDALSDRPKKITKEEAEAAEKKFLEDQAKKKPEPDAEESTNDDFGDEGDHDYSSDDDWMGADEMYDQGGPENRD